MNLRDLALPALGLAVVGGGLLLATRSGGAAPAPTGERFGPYHKDKRPPGLPLWVAIASDGPRTARGDGLSRAEAVATARAAFKWRHRREPRAVHTRMVAGVSAKGAALPAVERAAGQMGLGVAFVRTMVQLAKGEGEGGTLGVPARNFDARYIGNKQHVLRRLAVAVDGVRASGRALITAAGVFQWNRDAGREADSLEDLGVKGPGLAADWMPWDWTHDEEVRIPVAHYARLWRVAEARGANVIYRARSVRLWHTGPGRYRRFIEAGADSQAWAAQPSAVTARIDHHLRNAAVIA